MVFAILLVYDVFHGTGCEAKHLKYISKHTKPKKVPLDIPVDTKLVDLRYNNIQDIEIGTFSNLSQCAKLNMAGNSLTLIRPGMFQGLQSLKELDLRSNTIGDIEPGSFLPLKQCKNIWLSGNQLTCLRAGIFKGLDTLDVLDLYSNEISVIEPGTFSHTPRLRVLCLNQNQLKALIDKLNIIESLMSERRVLQRYQKHLKAPVEQLLDPLKSNKPFLFLGRNPLQCDWKMCWIKEAERVGWLKLSAITGAKPQCENYPGTPWDQVTLTCDVSGKQNDVTFEDLLAFLLSLNNLFDEKC